MHLDEARSCPYDPEQPCAGCMPETSCHFRTAEGHSMSTAASWWHCGTKVMSRSAGRSAVAAAAYRRGEKLYDELTDQTHDYTRRSGVLNKFTVAPVDAPEWAHDPERLWNEAEKAEKRINSRFARETELALPAFLSPEERYSIAYELGQAVSDRYGVVVSVAIHAPGKRGDQRNYHAHLMFTTREMTPEGLGKKTRILDDQKTGPEEFKKIQELGADITNRHLSAAGSDIRVDHRSFQERGIEQEPTTHLGPAATEIERRGEKSDRGDINREVEEHNRQLEELKTERKGLDAAIEKEQDRITSPPRERDDAQQRVREDVRPFAEAVKTRGAVADIQTTDGLTWWQRTATRIAQKARSIVMALAEKARDYWQSREQSEQHSRDDDGARDR